DALLKPRSAACLLSSDSPVRRRRYYFLVHSSVLVALKLWAGDFAGDDEKLGCASQGARHCYGSETCSCNLCSRGPMKRTVSYVFISLLLAVPLFARNRTDLNADWLFSVDPEQVGEKQGWQNHPPVHTESVTIPHTWNLGKHDGYL